jgi:hypothetical protein
MLAKDRDERLATAGLAAAELEAIERELPDDTLAAPASTNLQQQVPTYVLPRRTTAASAIPAATAAALPAGQAPPVPVPGAAPAGRSRKGLWIGLGLAFVLFLGLVAAGGTFAWRYYQKMRGGEATPADTVAQASPPAGSPKSPASTTSPAPPPAAPAAPAPGKPEVKPAEVPVVVGQPIQIRDQPPPERQRPPATPVKTEPPTSAPAMALAPPESAHRTPPVPTAPASGHPAPVPAPTRPPESAPEPPTPEPARQPEASQQLKTGMSLAFRITPPDAFILVDGTVIGRADEWSGQKGTRPYTLAEAGEHTIKIKKPGMKDYRIALDASETSGTTQVTARLQPLPTHEVSTADLQSYHVRRAIGFKGAPEGAEVLVDGNPSGPARRFACGVFGRGGLDLTPGTHRVTVSAPGYAQRDLKVEVDDEGGSNCQAVDLNMARGGGG